MSKMRDADMPLVERIGAAIERIVHGQAAMRVPVEATDPDVVLVDCQREIERLTAERDELRDVLLRGGFVPCGIPACNCGSWHHRYGLPERMQEIKDELAEAGHELSNANGNLTLNALKALVAERDELRRQLAEAEQDALRYRWLRRAREHWDILHRYDEDSRWIDLHGNDLDATIDAAMGGSNE